MLKGLTGTEKECYHYYLEESRISLKVSFSVHFFVCEKFLGANGKLKTIEIIM